MGYAIIAENDTSQWNDLTGELYHFPNRYINLLQPGTKVIYYKGKLKDKAFEAKRLTNEPHYFGLGEIGSISLDASSNKKDYFGEIKTYVKFSKPVPIILNGNYVETIPQNRKSNYWRDGVREIDESTYNTIKVLAEIDVQGISAYNDSEVSSPALESEYLEGGKKVKFTTTYERNAQVREQAVTIHGYNCMACGFNFEKGYGEWGKGYIHVHHLKPLSSTGEPNKINPKTDLITLCANCHSMVHRKKNAVLSMDDLKASLRFTFD